MTLKIRGIIVNATAIKTFNKKDGKKSESAVLHIMENTNDPYPVQVAVKASGEYASFAGCTGMEVECEYYNRVFSFKDKATGAECFGNDPYVRSIKIINADRSAMLDLKEKEA